MKLNIIKNVIYQKLKLKIDLKIIKLEDYILKQIHIYYFDKNELKKVKKIYLKQI